MADLKISQFTDGGTIQETDEIATNRGGINTKVYVGSAAGLDAGDGIGDLVVLEDVGGSPGLPAVDGSQLLNLPIPTPSVDAGDLTGTTLAANVVNSSLTSLGNLTALTMAGNIAMGANNITTTGSIGATGARALKIWAMDAEFTNAPTIGGNAATGTGGLVRATSPTLVSPVLGAASATSITFGGTAISSYVEGSYTPTLFNGTNVAASIAFQLNYTRIGNTVTVWGKVEIDPTAANTNTTMGMSLPIASDFATDTDAGGTAFPASSSLGGFGIIADTTNNRFLFVGYPGTASAVAYIFSVTYRVI